MIFLIDPLLFLIRSPDRPIDFFFHLSSLPFAGGVGVFPPPFHHPSFLAAFTATASLLFQLRIEGVQGPGCSAALLY